MDTTTAGYVANGLLLKFVSEQVVVAAVLVVLLLLTDAASVTMLEACVAAVGTGGGVGVLSVVAVEMSRDVSSTGGDGCTGPDSSSFVSLLLVPMPNPF